MIFLAVMCVEKSIDNKTLFVSEYFSPAAAFVGLVKSILDFQKRGSLPKTIRIMDRPLGPMSMPLSQPETLKEVKAAEGKTVLEAARSVDIFIPTLCFHEKLEPYGACRMCTVEVEVRGWTKLVAACLYPVEQDLIVRTRSEKVDKIRKMILEFLLAQEYGADRDRFEKESSFCILCGLCVRYCAEVKKKNAVGFVDCGARREIHFIPEIASKECKSCKECFPLCSTSYLQAAFVLTESFYAR